MPYAGIFHRLLLLFIALLRPSDGATIADGRAISGPFSGPTLALYIQWDDDLSEWRGTGAVCLINGTVDGRSQRWTVGRWTSVAPGATHK